MSKRSASTLLTLPFFLMACVTINVYFPAAAAEKAADRIIEDVWGKEAPTSKELAPENSSQLELHSPSQGGVVIALLDFFIPAAEAAEADISIATPVINRLKSSMKQRHSQLKAHFESGAIGLTRDALISIRDQRTIPLRERNGVKRLVADENGDRNALYRAIAQANGHPEWEKQIRMTFAKRWVNKARKGWWYQDGGGDWRQK